MTNLINTPPYDVFTVAFGTEAIEITFFVNWNKRHGGSKKIAIMIPRKEIEPQVQDILNSIYEIIDLSEDDPGPDTFTAAPDKITEALARAMGVPPEEAVARLIEEMGESE